MNDSGPKRENPTYWIMGAGQFGSKAAERLRKKVPEAVLTVVDQDSQALERLEDPTLQKVCGEAVSYLDTHLKDQGEPDWVIPAVPIHVAFEWVRRRLDRMGRVEVFSVPSEVEKGLPNPKRGPDGQLFVSYADFRCPDHCTEPYHQCTWTGKPRKGLLYRDIQELVHEDFQSIVIRSRQLAPGVGGYRPEALKEALSEVTGSRGPVLFATACLCHGVIHAFRFISGGS